VIREIAEPLTGARLQKVQQPAQDRVVLRARRPGQNLDLLIVAHPRFARLHFVRDVPPSPPSPSAFCMTLRKHLTGAIVRSIEQPPGDRLVRFRLSRRDEGGTPREFALVAELFGRSANVVLLDATGTVRAVLFPRPGGRRPLLVGEPYPDPPASRGEPAPDAGGPGARSDEGPYPVSVALERAFTIREREEHRARERDAARRDLERRRKRLASRRRKVEQERAGLGDPDEHRRHGDLLKANLGPLGGPKLRGPSVARVLDYHRDPPAELEIPLDPKRSLLENMEARFHKARRAERSAARIREHLAWIDGELARLDRIEERLDAAEAGNEIAAVRRALAEAGGVTRAARAAARGEEAPSGPRRFVSTDGLEILVGRNARENDSLTFRIARGNDWWFHVQDYPGSHVVVRTPKGSSLPPETLLDAAHLAAFHSEARRHATATVQYTQRKHVRKPRGAPPGSVMLARRKTVFLRPDAKRLDRLLGREPPFRGLG